MSFLGGFSYGSLFISWIWTATLGYSIVQTESKVHVLFMIYVYNTRSVDLVSRQAEATVGFLFFIILKKKKKW